MKSIWSMGLPRVLAAAACGLALQASAAIGNLSVVAPGNSGFNPQSHSSANLKTVDFNATTLANSRGIAQGSTNTAGGGAWSTTTTASVRPTGFENNFARMSSGTGGTSKSSVSFTNGTGYVSFLWHLGTGDSDNTITFRLSNGQSQQLVNCAASSDTCVGGYDPQGLLASIFNFIFGLTGQVNETQSLRVVYTPPTGVRVTSVEFAANRASVCVFWFLCAWESRNLSIDALSYDDNTDGTPLEVLDHVEVVSSTSSGLTCESTTFRVRACANADCTQLYTQGGITGTVSFARSGASTVNANYSIPAGESYSSPFSARLPASLLGASTNWTTTATATPAPLSAAKCAFGTLTGQTSSCTFASKNIGLKLDLADHRAGQNAALQVGLVKDVFGSCVNVLGGVGSLLTTVTASYGSATSILPTLSMPTGPAKSLPNGSALLGLVTSIAGGVGSNQFSFHDVGEVKLKLDVTGLSGLSTLGTLLSSVLGLSNDVVATVVPNAFKLEPLIDNVVVTSSPTVKAGEAFQLRVSAISTNGTVAQNFTDPGLAKLVLTKAVSKPVASVLRADPDLTQQGASFNNGAITLNLSWPEVGVLDLGATLNNFMGTGMNVTGSLSTLVASGLTFVPAKLGLNTQASCQVTEGGVAKAFAYAGQPVSVAVEALNAAGAVTRNYDGKASNPDDRLANAVAVKDAAGNTVGTLAKTAFENGRGAATVTPTLASKLAAPITLALSAAESLTGGATTASASSLLVRSGRIKLSNTFGSENRVLKMPIQLQYWSGVAWVPSNDNCTASLLGKNLLNRNMRAFKGSGETGFTMDDSRLAIEMNGATGNLLLTGPGNKKVGSVDVELNLSAVAPWLQSLDAAQGSGVYNPRARATFGVYEPESKKTVNIRSVY